MAILYTQHYRTVPAVDTSPSHSFHTGLMRWLGWSGNAQKLYTSRQTLNQWWPAGVTTDAGALGEVHVGSWVFSVPAPTTRLIVEANGYALAAGGTTWRLYSDAVLYRGIRSGSQAVASFTVVSSTAAWSLPVFLDVVAFAMPEDQMRFTHLRLTAENLNATARGRLWTMHVRPAPDTPP